MRISDWSSDVCSSDLRFLDQDLVHRRQLEAALGDLLELFLVVGDAAAAAADDKMGALDLALDKMASQMRKAADRRRVHRGRHTPVSVGEAMADADPTLVTDSSDDGEAITERQVGPTSVTGAGPLDRKSAVLGKRGSVRVDLGGRRH